MRTVRATLALVLSAGLLPTLSAQAAEPAGFADELAELGHPAGSSVTMALRDLVRDLPSLAPSARIRASRLLARPTDGASDPDGNGYTVASQSTCSVRICVHWVASTEDAPPLADSTGTIGVPDWVETTMATVEAVWTETIEVRGFRAPRPDGDVLGTNPDAKFDVYLANLGDESFYGFCTTDDPAALTLTRYDVSAFCVLDNDFSEAEFDQPPLDSLQVTTAHEFFHAVQFAYDFREDSWLLESTAAWIEDEIYDDVNDNLQYLPTSPLGRPGWPMDLGRLGAEYGSWIWFRFLTESLGEDAGAFMLDLFDRLDGAAGAPDRYSAQGMKEAMFAAGIPFRDVFPVFHAVNTLPAAFYEEGATYPRSPLGGSRTLKRGALQYAPAARQDHLSGRAWQVVAGGQLPTSSRLRIEVDLEPTARGTGATVLLRRRSGTTTLHPLRLNAQGDGTVTLPFNPRTVRDAFVVLVNGSTRYNCWQDSTLACSGVPLDNQLPARFTARAIS